MYLTAVQLKVSIFFVCPFRTDTRLCSLGFQFDIWKKSCDQLASVMGECSQTLLLNLQRFQELGDKSGAATIRSSCVNCLAHLAVLYQVLGPESESLCDSTLERLSELAGDMRTEEYTRLDLLLGVRVIL